MNKYFTKYLPIDEEITDGTKVMFLINRKWTEPCDFDSFIGPQIEKVAQGKLFLCSTDIRVGDKFIHNTNATNTEQTCLTIDKENNIIQDEEHNFFMLHFCFKIIGVITKEAVWVTEGMTFDENEVGVLYNFVGEDSDDELYTLDEWPIVVKKRYKIKIRLKYVQDMINNPHISIKCPTCKTFH